MRHAYRADQWIPFPVDRVFAFFANPGNLSCLMPAWQQVRLEKSNLIPPPGEPRSAGQEAPEQSRPAGPLDIAGAGSTMAVSFRPVPFLPLRLRWEVHITEFANNEFFCDRQEHGPFRFWRHCHRTRGETRDGVAGTVVTDELEYELPMGLLGDIVDALAVRGQIESLFAYRQRKLPELLHSGGPCP